MGAAAYNAWVKHRMSCEKCGQWFAAEPGSKKCSTGEKLHRQMMKENS